MYSWVAMTSMSSGCSCSRKRYISLRHDQKLSPCGPPFSVRPAMPRWNAVECRHGMPGITGPSSCSALPAGTPDASPVITPASSTSNRTFSRQPVASRADDA